MPSAYTSVYSTERMRIIVHLVDNYKVQFKQAT